MFRNKERYQKEQHHRDNQRIQEQNLNQQCSYNKELIGLIEREIKEQELENQRVKTLEYKIIKENEKLIEERDLYKSYFDFFKSTLIDTEVFTDVKFSESFSGEQRLVLKFRGDHSEYTQVEVNKETLTMVLMQKLGRDVMRPFDYAKQVLQEFFKITYEFGVNRPIHSKFKKAVK